MSKVLLVEDDADLHKMYKDKLRMEGYEVMSAYNGKQALNLIKAEVPNLILLDIMLPQGMNGFDFLEKVKEDNELKNIPVIVLTNLENEDEVAQNIGISEYLLKINTKPSDIANTVKKYI